MRGLDRINQVCYAVCLYGLHQHPNELSHGDREEIKKHMTIMLSHQVGVPTKEIVEAIRHGMKEVWPFLERGFFDARDVRNNIAKAKAAASNKRKRGELPMTIEEVRTTRARHEGEDE